jgi:hypothetical protein
MTRAQQIEAANARGRRRLLAGFAVGRVLGPAGWPAMTVIDLPRIPAAPELPVSHDRVERRSLPGASAWTGAGPRRLCSAWSWRIVRASRAARLGVDPKARPRYPRDDLPLDDDPRPPTALAGTPMSRSAAALTHPF